MSKPYRISLPASRTELTQVLDHLQDAALQASDRPLWLHLVQQ
jgi:hypothetical protein